MQLTFRLQFVCDADSYTINEQVIIANNVIQGFGFQLRVQDVVIFNYINMCFNESTKTIS